MGEDSAPTSKGKKVRKREKKQKSGKKHQSLKAWESYDVSGDSVSRKKPSCPRCGEGTFLASHKDRRYCGKCGYTEFSRGAPQEQVKAEAGEAPSGGEKTGSSQEEVCSEEGSSEESPAGETKDESSEDSAEESKSDSQ